MKIARKAPKTRKAVKARKTPKVAKKVTKTRKTVKSINKSSSRSISTHSSRAKTIPGVNSIAQKKFDLMQKSFQDEMASSVAASMAAIPETTSQQERTNILATLQVDYAKGWLTRRGLFFEDMFEDYAHTRLAVYMLPSDVRKDRFRRWLRALDMDLKFQYMPEEQRLYDPFVSYGLSDLLDKQAYYTLEPQNYV